MGLNKTLAFTCCAFNFVNKCLPLGAHPRGQAMMWIKQSVSTMQLNASHSKGLGPFSLNLPAA